MTTNRSARAFAIVSILAVLLPGCGGGGGSAGSAPVSTPSKSLELVAGTSAPGSSLDGPASLATFGELGGIAVAANGTVYVSDTGNHNIRAIDPNGTVRTVAGNAVFPGSSDGPAADARFQGPSGLAVDGLGNLYIADTYDHRIRRLSTSGIVSTVAGDGTEGSEDGPGQVARFRNPRGIALDADGNLYVADWRNSTIRRITRDGIVSTVAGAPEQTGAVDGPATTARLSFPTGVAIDPFGDLIIADSGNRSVRKLARSGSVTTVAQALSGTWFAPTAVAVDAAGTIRVADSLNHVIHSVTHTVVATPLGVSGTPGLQDGIGAGALFNAPVALAFAPDGRLMVADQGNRRVRAVAPGIPAVTTLAGSDMAVGNGLGSGARFSRINALAPHGSSLLVSDSNAVKVLTTAGATRLLAGIQGISLAVVSDGGANAIAPQAIICGGRFTPNCVPGMEFLRISDGGDVALMQRTPGYVVKALVRDGVGNYYLTQYGSHAIYKWTPGVGISVHAGGGAGASDGLVGEARFSEPSGLAFDALGNLFVADSGNHAIRRISTTGEVTTFARFTPLAMTEPATMHLAIDAGGNVYMADGLAHVVRKFARDGSASILVGVEGRPGFATGALPALLQRPTAVAVLGNDLYIGTDNAVLVVKGVQP